MLDPPGPRDAVAAAAVDPRRKRQDWSGYVAYSQEDCELYVLELARQLGVSALPRLGVGYDRCDGCWTFPARDAAGRIIGVLRRYAAGSKLYVTGGSTGLYYSDEWSQVPGPIILPEGPTCTAALLDMQLACVGRPSCDGGIKLLAELLAHIPADRQILVIGERDARWEQTRDGELVEHWPGREGAITTAERLARKLRRPIDWALPPEGAKDSRDWLRQQVLPLDSAGERFLAGLVINTVEPPPRYRCEISNAPIIDLNSWRDQMVQARRESLRRSGIHLDRSQTGSGKSYVDITIIQHLQAEDTTCSGL